jgi:hypothetical protein
VPITTKVVGSNPSQVYSIQHYVIKFVSNLRQVGGFLRVLRFPPPIKLTATEILLKVALKTINLNKQEYKKIKECTTQNPTDLRERTDKFMSRV